MGTSVRSAGGGASSDRILRGAKLAGDDATGAQVIAWYGSHHTADFVFDIIGGLAVLFLVLFAVALVRQVRTGDRWLAHGALAAAVFGGVGFLTSVGLNAVLAQDHNHLSTASAQTLNLLDNDFFLPILVGFALFGILTGLAVVVGRILPKWMGWVMFAFGLAAWRSRRLLRPAGDGAVGAGGRDLDGEAGPPVPDRVTRPAEDHVTADSSGRARSLSWPSALAPPIPWQGRA